VVGIDNSSTLDSVVFAIKTREDHDSELYENETRGGWSYYSIDQEGNLTSLKGKP